MLIWHRGGEREMAEAAVGPGPLALAALSAARAVSHAEARARQARGEAGIDDLDPRARSLAACQARAELEAAVARLCREPQDGA